MSNAFGYEYEDMALQVSSKFKENLGKEYYHFQTHTCIWLTQDQVAYVMVSNVIMQVAKYCSTMKHAQK